MNSFRQVFSHTREVITMRTGRTSLSATLSLALPLLSIPAVTLPASATAPAPGTQQQTVDSHAVAAPVGQQAPGQDVEVLAGTLMVVADVWDVHDHHSHGTQLSGYGTGFDVFVVSRDGWQPVDMDVLDDAAPGDIVEVTLSSSGETLDVVVIEEADVVTLDPDIEEVPADLGTDSDIGIGIGFSATDLLTDDAYGPNNYDSPDGPPAEETSDTADISGFSYSSPVASASQNPAHPRGFVATRLTSTTTAQSPTALSIAARSTAAQTPTALATASAIQTSTASALQAPTAAAAAQQASVLPQAPANAASQTVHLALFTPSGTAALSASKRTDLQNQAIAAVNAASAFWSYQSGGAISFTVGDVRWYEQNPYACNTNAYTNVWQTALSPYSVPAFNPNGAYVWPNTHLMAIVATGCPTSMTGGATGIGTIGAGLTTGGLGISWAGPATDVVAHELGHNLSLMHANLLDCGNGKQPDITLNQSTIDTNNCSVWQYGDPFDVMGFSGRDNIGSLNTAAAGRLGFPLGTVSVANSPTTVSVTLTALAASGGTRAVRVVDPSTKEVYWVELRLDTGYDSNLAVNSWLASSGVSGYNATYGIRISKEVTGAWASGTWLSHGTVFVANVVSPTQRNSSFTAGQTFVSVSNQVRVTVNSISGNTANVTIRTGNLAPALSRTTAQSVVTKLYHDLLGRPPEAAGLANWTNQLASGVSQSQLVHSIVGSREYTERRIIQAYQQVLGRGVDAGYMSWVTAVSRGQISIDDVALYLYASQEFYIQSGGTPAGFVRLLYQRMLGRNPNSAEITSWVKVFSSQGRPAVIDGIWRSREATAIRVGAYYQTFLLRKADAGGITTWSNLMLSQGEEAVREGIAGSVEYRNLAVSIYGKG